MRGLKTTLLGRPEEFESRTRFSDSMGGLGAYRTIQFFRARRFCSFKSQSLEKSNSEFYICPSADFGMIETQTRKWKIENSKCGAVAQLVER